MDYGLPSGCVMAPPKGSCTEGQGWGWEKAHGEAFTQGPSVVPRRDGGGEQGGRVECPVIHQRAFPAGGQGAGSHRTKSTKTNWKITRQHRWPALGQVRFVACVLLKIF